MGKTEREIGQLSLAHQFCWSKDRLLLTIGGALSSANCSDRCLKHRLMEAKVMPIATKASLAGGRRRGVGNMFSSR